jgi:polyisoprenoid-binding protein YceI
MKTLLVLLCMLLPVSAFAADWQIESDKSHILFSGTHAGNEFDGEFSDFNGDITFDPDALDKARVVITVNLASAKTGDATYDKTLPQGDWLNSEKAPKATFSSEKFEKLDDGHYKITGTLALRDAGTPVTLYAKITIDGDKATVDAKTELNRMDFNIGKSSDAAGEWVSLEIPVKIKLVATKK